MTTLTTVHLAPVAMPRGAVWAADAVVSVYRRVAALRARWAERRAGRVSDAEAVDELAEIERRDRSARQGRSRAKPTREGVQPSARGPRKTAYPRRGR